MGDVHLTQFTGSRCGPFNCAASSDAMAINFAGGPLLTSDQVRTESGVSCVPGVDTLSGGLRISDVKRVAAAHGVTLDYGAPTSWPRDELRRRLVAGDGAIVLGDCQDAPVNPTFGVVYHSAFVHGLDINDRTHWHDPRLPQPYSISLAAVIAYWESFENGLRYAGFVKPNQAGTPPDTGTGGGMGPIALNPRRTSVRQVRGINDGAYRRCFNVKGELYGIPTDVRDVFCLVDINPAFTARNAAESVTFAGEMFQISGNEVTYAYPRDVDLVSAETPVPPDTANFNAGVEAASAKALEARR